MANVVATGDLDELSRSIAEAVRDGWRGGFNAKDISRARDLQDHLSSDLCGIYLLNEGLQPNATLVSQPADGFLKGYEAFRNRDPIFLHLLRRRQPIDGVALLGFEAWLRHPLARYMKNWNLHYSMQGVIAAGERVVATLNFARHDRYGPFSNLEVDQLKAVCDAVSVQLLSEGHFDARSAGRRTSIAFSDAVPGRATYRILTDGQGAILDTDLVAPAFHPCLALDDLERCIAGSIKALRDQGTGCIERDILEEQTVIAKLRTLMMNGDDSFITFLTRVLVPTDGNKAPLAELGHRARAVLDLVVRGYSNKLIARELGISENTVKDHLRRIYDHFGVGSRTELTWILHG